MVFCILFSIVVQTRQKGPGLSIFLATCIGFWDTLDYCPAPKYKTPSNEAVLGFVRQAFTRLTSTALHTLVQLGTAILWAQKGSGQSIKTILTQSCAYFTSKQCIPCSLQFYCTESSDSRKIATRPTKSTWLLERGSNVQHILTLQRITNKYKKLNKPVYAVFVDFRF